MLQSWLIDEAQHFPTLISSYCKLLSTRSTILKSVNKDGVRRALLSEFPFGNRHKFSRRTCSRLREWPAAKGSDNVIL